jgi:hypothetical protein
MTKKAKRKSIFVRKNWSNGERKKLSEFFPAKIFVCSERFLFSKIPEKIWRDKN